MLVHRVEDGGVGARAIGATDKRVEIVLLTFASVCVAVSSSFCSRWVLWLAISCSCLVEGVCALISSCLMVNLGWFIF